MTKKKGFYGEILGWLRENYPANNYRELQSAASELNKQFIAAGYDSVTESQISDAFKNGVTAKQPVEVVSVDGPVIGSVRPGR